jgi:vancomycin permeability regulator SanA
MNLWNLRFKSIFKRRFLSILGKVFFCGILFLCGLIIRVNIFIYTAATPFLINGYEENLSVDAVMILWSKVYSDGRLSRAVKERADSAIALRKAWKAHKNSYFRW